MRSKIIIGITIGIVMFFASLTGTYAAVSMVSPNGGECFEVGGSYTVTITFDADHVALYYKTDGTQPDPAEGGGGLDPSFIRHPLNQTTWSWTPGSGDISETGVIWVEGHQSNHWSNNEWDSSANFSVRTSCVTNQDTGGRASFSAFPPLPTLPFAHSPTSIQWNFKSPGYNIGQVRLFVKENFMFVEKRRETKFGNANTESFIVEKNLMPNTHYAERYLQVTHTDSLTLVSSMSNPHYPIYTLIEIPKLAVESQSATHVTFVITNHLSHLDAGLSGVLFENIVTGDTSGWQEKTSWTFENLEPDTLYQFQAKARNGEGLISLTSEVLSVITPLAAPKVVAPTSSPALSPTVSPEPSPSVSPTPPSGASLLRAEGDVRVYVVERGFRRHIPSPEVFVSYGFLWSDISVVSTEELSGTPSAKLFRIPGNAAVWLVSGKFRRHILNPEVFSRHSFLWEEIVEVNIQELSWYTPAMLLRGTGDTKVWKIENGKKRWITTLTVFTSGGFRWEDVQDVPLFEIESYKEGEPLA